MAVAMAVAMEVAMAVAMAVAMGPRDQWGQWVLLALLVQCHQWVQ